MLKKVNRLAKSKEIQNAFARGRTFFNPFYNLKAFLAPGTLRFTVVVSTKVFKKAVDRNRTKRIIREHLRNNLKNFKQGNYIIIVKPTVTGKKNEQLVKELKKLLINISA